MKTILNRQATTYGGRNGTVKDMASEIELPLAKPEEMGGSPNKQTNPEELFSMGYSACFASSIEYLLEQDEVSYEDITVRVEAALLAKGESGFEFAVTVYPRITGLGKDKERSYVDRAYDFCPFSKAIRNNVRVTIEIER
ncbi:MAG: Ohr family peroxiredoxin [Acholeplasmataceae bacterium]